MPSHTLRSIAGWDEFEVFGTNVGKIPSSLGKMTRLKNIGS